MNAFGNTIETGKINIDQQLNVVASSIFHLGTPIIAIDMAATSTRLLRGIVAHAQRRFRPSDVRPAELSILPVAVVRSQFAWNLAIPVGRQRRGLVDGQEYNANASLPCTRVTNLLGVADAAARYASYVASRNEVAATDLLGVFAQCTNEMDAAHALFTIDAVFAGHNIGSDARRLKRSSSAVFASLTSNHTSERFRLASPASGVPTPDRETHMQYNSIIDVNAGTLAVLTSVIMADTGGRHEDGTNDDQGCTSHSTCQCSDRKISHVFRIGDVCKCQCSNVLADPLTTSSCQGKLFGIMVFRTQSALEQSDSFQSMWRNVAPLFRVEANNVLKVPVAPGLSQGIISCVEAVPERLWITLHTTIPLSMAQCGRLTQAVSESFMSKRYVFGVGPGETNDFQMSRFMPFMCSIGNTTAANSTVEVPTTRSPQTKVKGIKGDATQVDNSAHDEGFGGQAGRSTVFIVGVMLIALAAICVLTAAYIRKYWFRPAAPASLKIHNGQGFFEDNLLDASQGLFPLQPSENSAGGLYENVPAIRGAQERAVPAEGMRSNLSHVGSADAPGSVSTVSTDFLPLHLQNPLSPNALHDSQFEKLWWDSPFDGSRDHESIQFSAQSRKPGHRTRTKRQKRQGRMPSRSRQVPPVPASEVMYGSNDMHDSTELDSKSVPKYSTFSQTAKRPTLVDSKCGDGSEGVSSSTDDYCIAASSKRSAPESNNQDFDFYQVATQTLNRSRPKLNGGSDEACGQELAQTKPTEGDGHGVDAAIYHLSRSNPNHDMDLQANLQARLADSADRNPIYEMIKSPEAVPSQMQDSAMWGLTSRSPLSPLSQFSAADLESVLSDREYQQIIGEEYDDSES